MARKIRSLLLVASAALVASSVAAVEPEEVEAAEELVGLEFTEAERALMLGRLAEHLDAYTSIRELSLPNALSPAPAFRAAPEPCAAPPEPDAGVRAAEAALPADLERLGYYSIAELGALIRQRELSVVDLTRAFLDRLEREGEQLRAIVTLTEERALARAAELDRELAAGEYRGALHGIPYGAKDLFAVAGYPTTWGAAPFRDRRLEETASVIRRLDEAGAVLVAKLSLGSLAFGDVWFGGRTRNPWNLEQGSSGSSAGSAAAVAAGLVPFALGTETYGSIVSPAHRVGVTGLRPTFGRVSRDGVMSLAWSMDKVGVLCRSAVDCEQVFRYMHGCDGRDASIVAAPYAYPGELALDGLRIGYPGGAFAREYAGREQDLATLATLEARGAELVPIELPDYPVDALSFLITVEAAAAFDELTRSDRDDALVRQDAGAWPNRFRAARLVPAVEYVQAQRIRGLLIREMEALFEGIEVYVAPSVAGDNLLLTNLTGHPAVVVPNGLTDEGTPTSISFIGRPFDEGALLGIAAAYQAISEHHRRRPPAFDPEAAP